MDKIKNPRLQRLKMKIAGYTHSRLSGSRVPEIARWPARRRLSISSWGACTNQSWLVLRTPLGTSQVKLLFTYTPIRRRFTVAIRFTRAVHVLPLCVCCKAIRIYKEIPADLEYVDSHNQWRNNSWRALFPNFYLVAPGQLTHKMATGCVTYSFVTSSHNPFTRQTMEVWHYSRTRTYENKNMKSNSESLMAILTKIWTN